MLRIGIIGKTNTGKTTFFNSATSQEAEVSTYPFTTKKPNRGTAFAQTHCVCGELDLKDNPRNSRCLEGWRFVPFELIDLPGLIKGSWTGKGLGTQFLSVAAQAEALLHIVDASGSIDEEGRLTKPGMGNPVVDVYDIEEELMFWLKTVVSRVLTKLTKHGRKITHRTEELAGALAGLKITEAHVQVALEQSQLTEKPLASWKDDDETEFARSLREVSKPTIIIANKMDLSHSESNFEKLRDEFKGKIVIPACSEAELALRRAQQKAFIEYVPGEESFRVKDRSRLTKEQLWALNYVEERVLSKWINTGVQFALNTCVFKLLGLNTVYPVEDPQHFSDKRGNVLPDAHLVSRGATPRDLAQQIHSEIARSLLYAIDARSGLRLPNDYFLKDRDVISLVATAKKRKPASSAKTDF